MSKWLAITLLMASSAWGAATSVSDAQISRSGSLLFVRLSGPVTGVATPPTVMVDGVATPLNPQPFWGATSHRFPWVCYQLATPIKPGQTVTYSAPAAFASCSTGPAPAVPDGSPVNNYAGTLEPQFQGPPTMRVGANHSPSPASWYSVCPIGQDLSVRFVPNNGGSFRSWPSTTGINAWISTTSTSRLGVAAGPTVVFQGPGTGAVATCAIVGGLIQSIKVIAPGAGYTDPTTISIVGGGGGGGGAATCTVSGGVIQSVTVTNGGAGYCDGTYTLQWDDTAPKADGTPTTLLSLYDGTQGTPLLYVTPIGASNGVNIKGMGSLYGCSKTYYIQYRPEAAYSYGAGVGMWFKGGSWNGTSYVNTARNWTAVGPGNVPNRGNPVEPDAAALDWCTFAPGVGVSTLRYMSCTLPAGGVSNAANPPDVTSLADPSFDLPAPRLTPKIIAARPLLRSVSPNIVLNGPSPGSTATAPYTIPLLTDGVPNLFNNPTYASVEFVTDAPHGLATYQQFWSTVAATNKLSVVNAAGATADVVIPGYPNSVWVTGPNTFAAVYSGPPGGPWNAAAVQPNVVFPFYAIVTTKEAGSVPYETAAGFSAAVPGCGAWINIPAQATDALITSIIQSTARWLPPGRKIWVEYVNEAWNDGFPYHAWFTQIGHLSGLKPEEFYTGRTAQVHKVAASVLADLGRGNDLVRVFGTWVADAGMTGNIIAYANKNNIQIDVISPAPYWVCPADPPIVLALASVVSTSPVSIAHGTAWPWTRAMGHELLRNMIISDTSWIGPTGMLTRQKNALLTYKVGPIPRLVAYEGSTEQLIPDGIGADKTTVQRDMFFDPGMYDTTSAYLRMCQLGGLDELCYFQLASDFWGGASWNLATFSGQAYGRGDGSDGRAVNRYWMDGGSVAGSDLARPPYSQKWDRYNCSPAMAAWRDWGKAANRDAIEMPKLRKD